MCMIRLFPTPPALRRSGARRRNNEHMRERQVNIKLTL